MAWLLQGNAETLEAASHVISTAGADDPLECQGNTAPPGIAYRRCYITLGWWVYTCGSHAVVPLLLCC